MVVEFSTARNGSLTARANGVRLHSFFNPELEAERVVTRTLGTGAPETVLIIGESLGYLTLQIRKRYPHSKIIAIYFDHQLFDKSVCRPDAWWHPGCPSTVAESVAEAVYDFEIVGLKVVVWEPSSAAFPEAARNAEEQVAQLVRESSGNLLTTSGFGRRWLMNLALNLSFVENIVTLTPGEGPIVIAASGPTLRSCLPTLRRLRSAVEVWALPSSVPALLDDGLFPDLVVTTDPGYYAFLHLGALRSSGQTVVAAPLTARLDLANTSVRYAPFTQSSAMETLLLSAIRLTLPVVRPNGSVAGTALNLALARSRETGLLILAGLDFCFSDIQEHVSPHSFDAIFESKAQRTNPTYSQRYARALSRFPTDSTISSGVPRSLQTYAGWFSGVLPQVNARVFRLAPSRVPVTGATEIDAAGLQSLVSGFQHRRAKLVNLDLPKPAERRETVAKVLKEVAATLEVFATSVEKTPVSFFDRRYREARSIVETLDTRKMIRIRKARGQLSEPEVSRQLVETIEGSASYLQRVAHRLVGA